MDLEEKRLSDQQIGIRDRNSASNSINNHNNNTSINDRRSSLGSYVPQLAISPPPPPGSRLAPPAPPPRSLRSSSSSQPITPTSTSAGLQSPRLSFIPVSPIDAAFAYRTGNDDFEDPGEGARSMHGSKRSSGTGTGISSRNDDAALTASTIGLAIGRAPSTRSARGQGTSRYVSGTAATQSPPHNPVSPIEDEDDDIDADGDGDDADSKRVSFVSAPSVAGDGPGDDAMVSPITPKRPNIRPPSPDDVDDTVSPATVSPVESRRGSLSER